MAGWGEVAPDIVLSSLYIVLLILLATDGNGNFNTPFYTFFIATGIYSVLTVVSFHFGAQFAYSERCWTYHFYKPLYALNAIGAFGSTIGKTIIVIQRYFVIRNRDFTEQNWSSRIVRQILAVQCVISVLLTASIWPASFAYADELAKDKILGLSDLETMIQVAIAVISYTLYTIFSILFSLLTWKELFRLRRDYGCSAITSKTIMDRQRSMIIIVAICSASHLLKMVQQLIFAVATFLKLDYLFDLFWPYYPAVNGFASYAAPVSLVIFSRSLRVALLKRLNCSRSQRDAASVRTIAHTV